ncbi:MAG: hypothetical protein ACTJHC_04095 [Vagococcus sp.]
MLVDSNLPVDRDRLKNRLIRLVKEDDEVVACFFGGSIGEKTEDYYSDIDARVIVKDNVDFEKKQRDIIRSIGEYLFIETSTHHYSTIHYATFIKLDLYMYTISSMTPSIWLKHIDIVKDDGLLEKLEEQSRNLSYAITQEEFDHILNNYYAHYFELYRCLKRHEDNYLELLMLSLKQSLVSMWYVSKGYYPNDVGEWGKYEGDKSKLSHLEKEFLSSFTPCTKEELETFTKQIAILMFEASEKVATYNELNFSRDIFRKVHKRISFSM